MRKAQNLQRRLDLNKERVKTARANLRQLKEDIIREDRKAQKGKAVAIGELILDRSPDLALKLAGELTSPRLRALFGLPPRAAKVDRDAAPDPAEQDRR